MAVPASGHWQSTDVDCESWNQGHGDQNSCLCFRSAEKSRYPKITLAAERPVANDREHRVQRGTWVLSWKRQESWRELAHYFPSNECGKKYHEGIYLGI
jgi:hypothetical protein